MRQLPRIRFPYRAFAPLVAWMTAVSCSMSGKDVANRFGTFGGGGGTTTGNALVRLTSYAPRHYGNGATQAIRITPVALRAREAATGEWTEVAFQRGHGHLSRRRRAHDEVHGLGQLRPRRQRRLRPPVSAIVGPDFGPYHHILYVGGTATLPGGGVAQLDQQCQGRAEYAANVAMLPKGRTWRAMVSTDTVAVRDRFPLRGDVYNSRNSGSQLLSEAGDFWSSQLEWRAPPAYSEMGAFVGGRWVFTGSSSDGSAAIGLTCDSWESNSGGETASIGDAHATGSERWSATPGQCNQALPFYCMSE